MNQQMTIQHNVFSYYLDFTQLGKMVVLFLPYVVSHPQLFDFTSFYCLSMDLYF